MAGILSGISIQSVLIVIYVINFICAVAIIFVQRKDPDATLAWLLVLFFIPVIGLILYLIFSQNIARYQIFRLTNDEKDVVTKSLSKQIESIRENRFVFKKKEAEVWSDLVRLNQRYDGAYLTQNNHVDVFTDGRKLYDALLSDIDNAKESIDVQYFIIKNDATGMRFLKKLAKKAEEGVKVRLLIDAMGSRKVSQKIAASLRESGCEVAYFFRPKLKILLMRLNYRNHRKIVVIDDRIGYIGGFNIANEYVDRKPKFGHWRDTHARIMGGAVIDLKARFMLDYRSASKKEEDFSSIFDETKSLDSGDTCIQIVSSGPDSPREQIKAAYLRMITSATDCIYLQSPYYVPDKSIQEALKMAAYAGVDVRIMIPDQPDHIFVYWATMSYVGDLLESGVKAYVYDGGFLHSKTIMVDDEVTSIGSANFDKRSFSLNFESNAIIYDGDLARRIRSEFENDMKLSHELTLEMYRNRSGFIKFKESISRLLSDIL